MNDLGRLLYKLIYGMMLLMFVTVISTTVAKAEDLRTIWQSDPVEDEVISVVIGEFDGSWGMDLVYCSHRDLVAARIDQQKIIQTKRLKFPKHTELHRLSLVDINTDGVSEILVNSIVNQRFVSQIYQLKNNEFSLLHEFDTLVMPLNLDGQMALYSQRDLGYGSWSGELRRMTFGKNKWTQSTTLVPLKKGLGSFAISMLNMTADREKMCLLRGDNRLEVKDLKGLRLWLSGLNYGGAADYYQLSRTNPLGLTTEMTALIAPRMLLDQNQLWIAKNDTYLSSIVGSVPNVKSARLVLLEWQNQDGFKEKVSSTAIDGGITDIQAWDYNQDGDLELLVVTLTHKSGFVDGYSAQKSRFSIWDYGTPPPPVVIEQPTVDANIPLQ